MDRKIERIQNKNQGVTSVLLLSVTVVFLACLLDNVVNVQLIVKTKRPDLPNSGYAVCAMVPTESD